MLSQSQIRLFILAQNDPDVSSQKKIKSSGDRDASPSPVPPSLTSSDQHGQGGSVSPSALQSIQQQLQQLQQAAHFAGSVPARHHLQQQQQLQQPPQHFNIPGSNNNS